MEIKKAVFHSSSGRMGQLPPGDVNAMPEVAFVGRSNVGKSSLINMLCNHKGLAKTSATPGKTQTVNLFAINDAWYLADLPGYGYAKTNKTLREGFQKLVVDYVSLREQLKLIFILADGRIPPQKIDLEFAEFLISENLPFAIIVTKTDKAKQKEINEVQNAYIKLASSLEVSPPDILLSSSVSKKGKEAILAKIASVLN